MRRILLLVTIIALAALPVAAQTPSDGTGGAQLPACHVRGALPDPACTPGAVLTKDPKVVCTSGYASSVRDVPASEKDAVYAEYGMTNHAGYAIDHLISLEVGGSNDITNLWPEPENTGWPTSKDKDLLEGSLARAVCAGRVSMADAQRWLATDWRLAWAEPAH